MLSTVCPVVGVPIVVYFNWFHTKFEEIHETLSMNLMDIFAISETKLSLLITQEFNVPECTLYIEKIDQV